ncbi:MAG: GLUG motif-containing protein [Phycisphaerae bacterium]|nr:GLUG motif-containing protein [Phycisphaerae bacterium]MDD5381557.1 GLUG motif-containing protein [Phycisphaerae bacterium]
MGRVFFAAIVFGGLVLSSICFGYSGGSGTEEDPYQIATAEDMNQIGLNYQDWDKHFKLTADINLSAYTGTQFSRIGTDDKHAFSGVFDGNRHTISNFTYTAESGDYIGIFGNVSNTGKIENVSLVDVNITGHNYVGGLVGINNGSISNCYSTGTVSGGSNSWIVGGLVGYNQGTIANCHSTGTVSDSSYSDMLGGLVGYNKGTIDNCNAKGDVSGGYNSVCLGGLVGWNEGGIRNCNSTATVTSDGDYSYYLGGLVGYTYGGGIRECSSTGNVTGGDYSYYLGGLIGGNERAVFIMYCYSTGNVRGGYESDYVGGLVGENANDSYVIDCYATGEVAGDYDVGGLVGINDNSYIEECYSSGSVSGYMYVGGLLGWNNGGTTTDSFWDIETSGQSWSAGGTGKTTAEMKLKSTFTAANWSFAGDTANSTDYVWRMCIDGVNYPLLWWQFNMADFTCPDGVSFIDFAILANVWLSDPTQVNWNERCDIAEPQDSVIDILDLAVFTQYWLED